MNLDIEKKWQDLWERDKIFQTEADSTKPKYYVLDMFPYPSGSGLHVGHMASYTPTDIMARYKRARGYNVLHPMGYDAFGLPAEQYAIQTGIHPSITTNKAIENFRRQLKLFGFSFDWQREISTCDPNFYKWTQYIFLKLFEKGLAYQKEVAVNWCPALKTVLANEEVVNGKSERGGHPVIRMPMKQWMLKITDYAERLLADLDLVDWPERTKDGQRNWIGKSQGAVIKFMVYKEDSSESYPLEVFTTRPDTLFGVTFMVLAPEHPLVLKVTSPGKLNDVKAYSALTATKSEVDRKANTEKTGVFTGAFVQHPLIPDKKIPIWIADYVLTDYGTGAIMAVPGHDERDFEFAQKFKLPILRVVEGGGALPFTGEGIVVNSEFLNGLNKDAAIKKMIEVLEVKKLGRSETQYKLRDWLFSRQRYWGEPFPVVRLENGELRAVPFNELPVLLPETADYEPSEKGEAPLARIQSFVNTSYLDPKTGKIQPAQRETDTMPGSAGSSWYFLRYTDPHNSNVPFSFEAQKYWMPVDLYMGGPEHTVGHLLYARFWHKVLFDAGLVSTPEPFKKLAHQGMILGLDGEKMSKSRGNVVSVDEVKSKVGSDAIRTFICFLGPLDKDKPWNPNGIEGVKRFLDRVWRLAVDENGLCQAVEMELKGDILKSLHKTIQKVTSDIESMSFNTAISAMMIFVNDLYKENIRPKEALRILAQLLMPFAPHLAEELWEKLGGEGYCSIATWPTFNPEFVAEDIVTLAVQVNGKTRGTMEVSVKATESEALAKAREISTVAAVIGDKIPTKIIYKNGKILNIII